MEPFLYILFSSIEGCGIFMLIFGIFKVYYWEVKPYLWLLFSSNIVLSVFSYEIGVTLHQDSISKIMNILLVIFLLRFMFKIKLFYSVIMFVTGFLSYGMVQVIIILMTNLVHVLQNPQYNNFSGYSIQLISAIIAIIISFVFQKKNWGFAFIPFGPGSKNIIYTSFNKIYLFFFLAAIALIVLMIEYTKNISHNIYLLSIILGIAFYVILILSIKKELTE